MRSVRPPPSVTRPPTECNRATDSGIVRELSDEVDLAFELSESDGNRLRETVRSDVDRRDGEDLAGTWFSRGPRIVPPLETAPFLVEGSVPEVVTLESVSLRSPERVADGIATNSRELAAANNFIISTRDVLVCLTGGSTSGLRGRTHEVISPASGGNYRENSISTNLT